MSERRPCYAPLASHPLRRFQERYGRALLLSELRSLERRCVAGEGLLRREPPHASMHALLVDGHAVVCVLKADRIVTFLPREGGDQPRPFPASRLSRSREISGTTALHRSSHVTIADVAEALAQTDSLVILLQTRLRSCSIHVADRHVRELMDQLSAAGLTTSEARKVIADGLHDMRFLGSGVLLGRLRDHVRFEARKAARVQEGKS